MSSLAPDSAPYRPITTAPDHRGTRRAPARAVLTAAFVAAALSACVKFPEPPPDWPGGDFTLPVMLERARASMAGDEILTPREIAAGAEPDAPTWRRVSYSLRDTRDFVAALSVTRPDGERESTQSLAVKWRRGGDWVVESVGGDPVRYVGRGGLGVELREGRVVRDGVTAEEVGVERLLRSLFVIDFFESDTGTATSVERVERRDDGGHAILLTKWDDRGMKWTLYLDSVTCRPLRLREWVRVSDTEGRPLDTFFSEFGPDRQGHLVPRVLRRYSGSSMIQETRIRDLDWNQGLGERDFAR